MTKGDIYHKQVIEKILTYGTEDENPRPKYKDGTPAHTLSYNVELLKYNLDDGDSPFITLRPIAWKTAIKEILWIWKDESNDLSVLNDKYGVHYWNNWALNDNTIGKCYGHTVSKYHLMTKLLDGLINNPFGRRHIASLWQEEEFSNPEEYALNPCCFMIMCNVRKAYPTNKLDMTLLQRSSDYAVSSTINEVQYIALMTAIARHCDLRLGQFSHFIQNVHVYDRHIEAAHELMRRQPIRCNPKIVLNPDKHNFYDIEPEDFTVEDYPLDIIKTKNPQIDIFRDDIAI